jgi:hypothetical protein
MAWSRYDLDATLDVPFHGGHILTSTSSMVRHMGAHALPHLCFLPAVLASSQLPLQQRRS